MNICELQGFGFSIVGGAVEKLSLLACKDISLSGKGPFVKAGYLERRETAEGLPYGKIIEFI